MQKECISAFLWPNPIKHAPNIHPNPLNSFYRTVTYLHEFSRPQVRFSAPCQHHSPTDNSSTTNYRMKKINKMFTLYPTEKGSRTSAANFKCANYYQTDSQEKNLFYMILYRILNFWNVTLLIFYFPGVVRHNLFLNSIRIPWNRTDSPKNLHQQQLTTPEEFHQHNHRLSNHLKVLHIVLKRRVAPSFMFDRIPYVTLCNNIL